MNGLKILCSTVFIFSSGLVALSLNHDELIRRVPLLYLGTFLASFWAIYNKKDLTFAYFLPSSIMVLYVSIFFLMGSWAFSKELVLMEFATFYEYYDLENLGLISFYFACSICVTLLSKLLVKRPPSYSTPHNDATTTTAKNESPKNNPLALLFSALIILVTSLIDVPLPGGGPGSYSGIFFLFAIIYVSYHAKMNGHWRRFFLYILFASIQVMVFYNDRRLLFFYCFILCFIEVFNKHPYRLRFRTIALFSLVAISLFTVNIAMAVQRGVGQFGSKSVADAFSYVDDYLRSDQSQTMLFHNFEGPGTFYYSYEAVDYMVRTKDYRYGSTIVKLLFIAIPRSMYPQKPRSMVDEYTTIYYPEFRDIGGSYVPNLYAEAYWNFGFIGGLIFLFVLFRWMDAVYFKWIWRLRSRVRVRPESVWFLSAFAMLPFLFRGSGFDFYGILVIIFYVMAQGYSLLAIEEHQIGKGASAEMEPL